jgi:hypothetical protein
MALTPFQRRICRQLAARRRAAGESYVAGGVALSVALAMARVSRDLDLFHDTTEAVARSWDADRETLEASRYTVTPIRERPGFVQATVSDGVQTLLVEWARDSAFRFFPLVEHDELGLTLHPFDLATNKVLALIGRLEARDWIDIIACDAQIQPFGYLVWAACGKDPGFTPAGVLQEARRSSHYSSAEIEALAFDGPAPDAVALGRRWHHMQETAEATIALLPTEHVGQAVLSTDGPLFHGDVSQLREAIAAGGLHFHPGRIGGTLPRIV